MGLPLLLPAARELVGCWVGSARRPVRSRARLSKPGSEPWRALAGCGSRWGKHGQKWRAACLLVDSPDTAGLARTEAALALSGQRQPGWARSVFAAAYSLVCRGVMDSVAAARARERSLGASDGGPAGADQVQSAHSCVGPNSARTLSACV
jgi:hypothetical protein